MRSMIALLVLASLPVFAQKPGHEASVDKTRTAAGAASKGVQACHKDIDRWCKGVKPGEGRLGACLKPHEKELSKSCRRWASHGGRGHRENAWAWEIDGSSAPAKPAEKE